MVAPLNEANSASGAIFRTTKYTVYANVIPTQSSFWCRQALISGPCDQHLSDSHQNPLGFTKSMLFCRKIEYQSNSLNSVRLRNISMRPGDHAPCLETHGNSVRLGRSGLAPSFHDRNLLSFLEDIIMLQMKYVLVSACTCSHRCH